MTALLEGLTHWHWLGLGFVLLAIEVLGSVGFLLWTGIAELLRALAENDIHFKDLRSSESSLEDIFVSLVHEKKEEARA